MTITTQWLEISENTCLCCSSISAITLEKEGYDEKQSYNKCVGTIHFHMVNPTDIWHIGDYPWSIAQKIYQGILYSLNGCSGVIDVVGLIKSCMESDD